MTLAVVCATTALLLLDVTAVNVALADIEHDLGATFDALQWVIDAYSITLAATLLTFGALADRSGRRRVMGVGLALFAAASALCAVAASAGLLDAARALQGVGAAAMFSTGLALLAGAYPPEARGRPLGIWGAVSGAALAAGPVVGGALVQAGGWRLIFWLNVPACALLAVALRRVPESRDPAARGLDLAGMATFGLGLFALVLGLIRGNPDGWDAPLVIGSLASGVLLLAAFAAIELRVASPMLDLRLFRRPAFSATAVVAFTQSVALYPMLLFVALYFQDVQGFSPLETGLRVLPVTLALFAVAPISGRLATGDRLRWLLLAGLGLIAAGLLVMRGQTVGESWQGLLPGMTILGVGVGVLSPALASAMVGVLPAERAGLASGVNNTFRQFGISAGLAGLGAVFLHHLAVRSEAAFLEGLDAVLLLAAVVALVGAVVSPLVRI